MRFNIHWIFYHFFQWDCQITFCSCNALRHKTNSPTRHPLFPQKLFGWTGVGNAACLRGAPWSAYATHIVMHGIQTWRGSTKSLAERGFWKGVHRGRTQNWGRPCRRLLNWICWLAIRVAMRWQLLLVATCQRCDCNLCRLAAPLVMQRFVPAC